ncbi:hypothetical protein PsAD5_04330 [Pseudovibrio sp. Ad5]|nr:hypothetical protein PsAD5_04330 [Pseudovibrio sp. Ad5]
MLLDVCVNESEARDSRLDQRLNAIMVFSTRYITGKASVSSCLHVHELIAAILDNTKLYAQYCPYARKLS